MWKRAIVSSAALFPLLAGGAAVAAGGPEIPESVKLAHPKCTIAQAAIAQNPEAENDKFIGTVYSIVGGRVYGNVWVELENGETRLVQLNPAQLSFLGTLLGRKLVFTNYWCEAVNFAPYPIMVQKPEPIVIEYQPPRAPELAPRPVVEPPVAEPAPVLPQTW